jgi:hypothetical protein
VSHIPNPFPGELGFCILDYFGSDAEVTICGGPKTCARYETGTSRPRILVDLRDRNKLLATGLFKLYEGKNDTGT